MMMALSLQGAKAQQQIAFGPLHSADSPREDWILPGDTIYEQGKPMIYSGKPMKQQGKLSAPASQNQQMAEAEEQQMPYMPTYAYGLHPGLNMSVDLSAFATFGKNVPHRGGFTQTIDAAYLMPLTKDKKLWMALGAYVNNINYGGDNYHDGGIYGMLGYKLNEHWEVYAYGQLSVANNYNSMYGRYAYGPWGYGYGRYPWGYGMMGRGFMNAGYGMGMPGANVLGAGVRYTNKNFSLNINVEGAWYDAKTPTYYKQYDYPVPELPGKK